MRDHAAPFGRFVWISVLVFGVVVNLLTLMAPLFMLQVYDRVLPAGAGPGAVSTLGVILALVAFLTVIQILIDAARTRLLSGVGAALQEQIDTNAEGQGTNDPAQGTVVHAVFAKGSVMALLDAPFSVLFAGVLFLCHPLLGWLAVGAAAVLSALVALGHMAMKQARSGAQGLAPHPPPLGPAMDLSARSHPQWLARRNSERARALAPLDRLALVQTAARHIRVFVQSLSLALGAWLVLQGALSPGLMIAASILQGRALAPVEGLVGQIEPLITALSVWRAHRRRPAVAPIVPMPAPRGALELRGVIVTGSGRALLQIDRLRIEPGQAVGVIGDSGAGKSVLAQTLAGVRTPVAGQMTLGGAALPLARGMGASLGYVGQDSDLPAGTVADIIRRFGPPPAEGRVDDVSEALDAVGAGALIAALPAGVATRCPDPQAPLSGGERQAILLARALYGAPSLVILDEPTAHLDATVSAALNRAIRGIKERGGIVVIMAHRPAAIVECDQLLVLEHGEVAAFGPRETVLRQMVRNHTRVARTGPGKPAAPAHPTARPAPAAPAGASLPPAGR